MHDHSFDRITGSLARGLLTGVAGTAAMTVSSTLEAKLRDRGGSDTPAQAAGEVLGVEPDEDAGDRFNQLAHWGYGTLLGGLRGAIDVIGLTGPAAAGAHFASILAAEQVVLPATGAAPPATQWGAEEVAIDWVHHAVYAAATSLAFAALDDRSRVGAGG